jgi:hypothetical protein
MKFQISFIVLFISVAGCQSGTQVSQTPEDTVSLFNGKNLDHWKGDLRVWGVEDECIVGRTTDDVRIDQNTFLIYENPFSNFELTFQYKIIGGNSGVQYRAKVLDDELFIVGGYQADMEAGPNYTGILYEEKGRGILAKRGESVEIGEDGTKSVTQFANSVEIQGKINNEQWNSYKVIADGNHLQHFINGIKTIDVIDTEIEHKSENGIIALQVHTGPNMEVYYKDIVVKKID